MNCTTPIWIEADDKVRSVPCGHCLFCLQNKRNDWVFRLEEEHKHSKGSVFLTLTYHPKFCPDSLNKKHFQLFMKRLRKRYGQRLRYFAVGEYGSKYGRPHYHAILFGMDVLDRKFLEDAWMLKGQPIGIIHVGKVSQASIRYVTKYVIQTSPVSRRERKLRKAGKIKGLELPFSLMSRSFGLGAWYLTDKMVAWHRSHDKNYVIRDGIKGRLPRYFKDKIWPWKEVRERVSKKSELEGKEASKKNDEILIKKGYDPEKIKAEMRDAVLSRIKTKITFTQKF